MSYEDNFGYAEGRLTHSAVLYRDKVVFVRSLTAEVYYDPENEDDEPEVSGEILANITYADGTNDSCSLSELDITPIPTGYYKDGNTWVFCARRPARRWKQGLSEENCSVACNGGDLHGSLPPIKGLQQIYDRDYKTKAQAFKEGGAFSRSFCVEDNRLYYQAEHVGDLVNGELQWAPNKSYLQRRLERTE